MHSKIINKLLIVNVNTFKLLLFIVLTLTTKVNYTSNIRIFSYN